MRRVDHVTRTRPAPLVGLGLVLALLLSSAPGSVAAGAGTPAGSAKQTIPQPSLGRFRKPLPVAPDDRRVDLAMPTFSNPTRITNPLFPISELHSAVLLGNIDQQTFRTETTLLPRRETIEWMGQKVTVVFSQYTAYLNGRIEEVALDRYAQADDGSVWYFGEDVFNYEDGSVADREGTWLAGEDGPPAMIMPAKPNVGDVFRPENAPGFVFEEVQVNAVGLALDGPRGRVSGAVATEELHMDGTREIKHFAPGYGEFRTGNTHELEALALAVPADALPGPPPAELETLVHGAANLFESSRAGDWAAATNTARGMRAAWDAFRARGAVPPLLESAMNRALAMLAGDAMAPALDAHDAGGVQRASTAVALAALDLELRHRRPIEIDRGRFEAWARQLVYDAGGEEAGAVAGDVTTLEWIRDRFAHALDPADAARLNAQLSELRAAADADDVAKAARLGGPLRETASALRLVSDRR